jgi:hypothetical protein
MAWNRSPSDTAAETPARSLSGRVLLCSGPIGAHESFGAPKDSSDIARAREYSATLALVRTLAWSATQTPVR